MRGDLQVRQGDAVYVLRDIPIKDESGKVLPTKKHTYETIGAIDYQECDIFRVEHLWKNELGKRFIFGHHFLRPHETFHEPSRRFYPNEVVRVSLMRWYPLSWSLDAAGCWIEQLSVKDAPWNATMRIIATSASCVWTRRQGSSQRPRPTIQPAPRAMPSENFPRRLRSPRAMR